MRRAAAFLLTMAAAAGHGGASAASFPAGEVVGGPALAGSHAVWAERVRGGLTVRSALGGHAPTTLASYPRESGLQQRAHLAASATRVTIERILADTGVNSGNAWRSRDAFAGPWEGPLEALGPRCNLGTKRLRTIDVSGDDVLYWDCDAGSAVVRDLATGASQQVPALDTGLRLAGRYVAWLADSVTLTVYDRADAQVAYVVKAPNEIRNFDLRDDGTLAVAFNSRVAHEVWLEAVAWASVAEPRLHTYSELPAAESYELRLAGDRLGFARGRVAGTSGLVERLGWLPVQGGAVHQVVTGAVEPLGLEETFDFDGGSFAWFAPGCRADVVYTTPLDRARDTLDRRGCALRFLKPAAVSGGRLRLRPDCFGFATCRLRSVVVTLARHRDVVIARGSGTRPKLTRAGRRALSHGRSRLRVRATIMDAAGRHERRSGTVAVKA